MGTRIVPSQLGGSSTVGGPGHEGEDLLIIGDDYKASQWAHHCAVMGCRVKPVASVEDALSEVVGALRRGRTCPAVMFRYLNDSPLLRRAVWKVAADLLLVGIVRSRGGKVYWLCHNVDRETREHFPRLTAIRRAVIGRASSVIFVTDPLLVEPARSILPKRYSHKLRWLCFGSFESWGERESFGSMTEPVVREAVERFSRQMRQEAKSAGAACLIGLCLGRAGDKYLHFDYAVDLLRAARGTRYHVALIVALDASRATNSRQLAAIRALRREPNALVFERSIGFHESEMAGWYDFIWRGVADWSTPITVYGAAAVGKPILALNTGFLAKLVDHYRLGITVTPDWAELETALDALSVWRGGDSGQFLQERGWDIGAEQLAKEIGREIVGRTDISGRS